MSQCRATLAGTTFPPGERGRLPVSITTERPMSIQECGRIQNLTSQSPGSRPASHFSSAFISILIGGDDLALGARAELPERQDVEAVLEEADRAVAHQEVGA